jgi:signal transduction histidine kinase
MRFKSIRSRLAFSFAVIALFVAAVLGAVLLPVLSNYYSNLELNYLRGNARTISSFVTGLLSGNASRTEAQSQIDNLAFLSQTEIQVYAANGHLLYDSGVPQNLSVNLGVVNQSPTSTNGAMPANQLQNNTVVPNLCARPSAQGGVVYPCVQVGGSPFGFFLNGEGLTGNGRSNLSVTSQVLDPQNSSMIGTVRLSEGLAYGRAVLTSVAKVWALAGLIAVLLAAGVGWFISRRFSAPVIALTGVTARMAQGDLSSRASSESRDEFGQLARSFNEMAQRVENTISTLRAFVADAAHELHTPLTALHTNLELAVDEPDPTRQTLFLTRAQEQNQRLEILVDGLLDLSRIEAVGTSSDTVMLDLNPLVQELGELFAARAEQAARLFALELPAETIRVRVDNSQIRRILTNLLENALKFTSPRGVITLRLAARDSQAVLSVSDTGIGIPPEDLPHLFERFHRGRNASRYPGSGLGLAIVKALVDEQGGTVRAESEMGVGTSIIVTLPLHS